MEVLAELTQTIVNILKHAQDLGIYVKVKGARSLKRSAAFSPKLATSEDRRFTSDPGTSVHQRRSNLHLHGGTCCLILGSLNLRNKLEYRDLSREYLYLHDNLQLKASDKSTQPRQLN